MGLSARTTGGRGGGGGGGGVGSLTGSGGGGVGGVGGGGGGGVGSLGGGEGGLGGGGGGGVGDLDGLGSRSGFGDSSSTSTATLMATKLMILVTYFFSGGPLDDSRVGRRAGELVERLYLTGSLLTGSPAFFRAGRLTDGFR